MLSAENSVHTQTESSAMEVLARIEDTRMGIKNDFRQGAKLETGGLPERGNGWYWKPTVPTKVIEDPALAQFCRTRLRFWRGALDNQGGD